MKLYVGGCKTQTHWRNETKPEHSIERTHGDPLPRIILKNSEKTALTERAAQTGRGFDLDRAHVLHHVNSYSTISLFTESLYITVKTIALQLIKEQNSQLHTHNVLKHE